MDDPDFENDGGADEIEAALLQFMENYGVDRETAMATIVWTPRDLDLLHPEPMTANDGQPVASKRLEQMRRNPRADWCIEDVVAVCKEFDVPCVKPTKGSHYKVSHPSQREIWTIPFKRPIKTVYIRKLVVFIDAVRSTR